MAGLSRMPKVFVAGLRAFGEDNGAQLAAAVAYYALFSLFPLVAAFIALARLVLPEGGLEPQVLNQAAAFMLLPPETLASLVDALLETQQGGVGALGLLGFLWSASGVFSALRKALEIAWDERSRGGLVRRKLLDLMMAGIAGALLLASIAATTALSLVRAWTEQFASDAAPAVSGVWALADTLLSLLINFTAFVVLYRYFPGLRPRGEVWFGALVAALGFEAAKRGFLWWLGHFGAFSAYGAFRWMFALLFWAYLSAAVTLYGAELVMQYPRVQERRQPSGVAPALPPRRR